MDELLKNFIKHIETNFSPVLSKELNEILLNELQNETCMDEIENKFKENIKKFFNNLKGIDYEYTAKKLYEAYVDYDDENLIRSIKFLIRIYHKFSNLKLARYFCNWRIYTKNKIYNKNISNEDNKKQNNYKSNEEINKNKPILQDNRNEKYNQNNYIDNIPYLKANNKENEIPQKKNIFNNFLDNLYCKEEYEKFYNSNNTTRNMNENNNLINYDNKKVSTYQNYAQYPKANISKKFLKSKNKNISINNSFNSKNHNSSNTLNFSAGSPDKKNFTSKNKNSENFKYTNNNFKNIIRPMSKDEKRNQIKSEKQKIIRMKDQTNSNSMNIFDKLYMESFKKNDEKLLNEEIKKLGELDSCTFRPNVIKRGSQNL